MREIIALCVQLDTAAGDTYARLSAACREPEIATLFTQMGVEEKAHVGWWSDLLEAWDRGLVPPVADEDELYRHLLELADDIHAQIPDDCSHMSTEEMLAAAAHLEFFMLDPSFAELIDLVRPTQQVDARDAYQRHIMRLVTAIEHRHPRGDVAHFLARALARALRDQQRLSQLATQDPLTGLYNRRGFYGYVRQWSSWATRYGHPLSVIIVDVDRFKSINDTYGHPTGDEALKTIATALRSAVRNADLVGRYGGDEFAILAPETDKAELEQLMERVLESIRAAQLTVEDATPVRMTVSVGGSFVSDGIPCTPEQLLAAADKALYDAKEAGRDQAATPRSACEI